jgi:two-component system, NarL family, sensor histidine kinase DegS
MAQDNKKPNPWDDFQREIEQDLEQSRRALKEITLMLEQSQAEMAKLTQRNAAVTGHLQQVQTQFATAQKEDIRIAYSAALDSQQRLLLMRGQLEKLQSDQASINRHITTIEKFKQFAEEGRNGKLARAGNGSATMELVISAQEAERQRLSRQMHDGPAQALSNFIVQAEIINRLFDIDPARAKEELANLKGSAMSTFQKVRTFIFDLRPMMLDDLGLVPTLRRYMDTYKEQTGLEVQMSVKGAERRFEPYVEVMIFRAVQELMGNTARHNQDHPVKPQINLQVMIEESFVKVIVSDNGKGFDPAAAAERGGLGLKLIRERAEIMGGFFNIDSREGQGCRVTFQVPTPEFVTTGAHS